MSHQASPKLNLPPLSGTPKLQYRRSTSSSYAKTSPEIRFRPTPFLPELWVRDAREMPADVAAELQEAWLRYLELGIPGAGDGAGFTFRFSRKARARLEIEYAVLEEGVRRAKEVALARYAGFCLRRDGSLDYHTGEKDGESCVML